MERKILIEVTEEEYNKIKEGILERDLDGLNLTEIKNSELIGELRRRSKLITTDRFHNLITDKDILSEKRSLEENNIRLDFTITIG